MRGWQARRVVLLALAGVALLVWVWLALFRGRFWRTDQRLPAGAPVERWPSVAIVVPARDEREMLRLTVPALLRQDYPGTARVIVVDDESTDGTAAVAAGLAQAGLAQAGPAQAGPAQAGPAQPGGLPLTVIPAGPRSPGWAGKVWALRAGVVEAGEVEFLLFTDADIAHRPDSLTRLVAAAAAHRLDLVSQLARLRVRTGWERLVVPAFAYFFALLYPFRWVNRQGARTAAAAGGCVLLRRPALDRAGGLAAIHDAVIDDVALARAVKRSSGRVHLGLAGDGPDSLRPYPTLGSLWAMIGRSAYAQLRYSPMVLAGTVAGLALVFVVPPAAVVAGAVSGNTAALAAGAAGWLLMSGTYLPTIAYYRQPWPAALLLPAAATLYLAMTVHSAIRHYRHGGPTWKGRTYPVGAPPVRRRST
jgi:hopene-associated glycosyltransferase HpnB